jgi:dTMP kinase
MQETPMRIIWRDCEYCGREFSQPDDPGRKRRFCADACKQAAYRARKRHADQARRRAEEDAARRAREERRRRDEQARQRQRAHRPPPHAGSSRPGPFCGACGGHRGPHTAHHDQAAHDRARRRYEGLRAKAAATGFAEEAAACRAKAEQLRAKYGL